MLDEKGGVYSFGAGRTGCLGLGDNEAQAFPMRITEFSKYCEWVDEKNAIF
mgnify:CR=1 FL=1